MTSTPTGIPVFRCDLCGVTHTATMRHCRKCGQPSHFITPAGWCLPCQKRADQGARELFGEGTPAQQLDLFGGDGA